MINRHPCSIIKSINHSGERVKMKNPQRQKAYSYVRFSTTDQKKGDSLDRQMEKTLKYIKEHDLELDTTLNLTDAGVSAFKGKNVDEGRLGQFIQAIDYGRVRKGSYLIVESLDRPSRQNVEDALELFLRIIRKGIIIVITGLLKSIRVLIVPSDTEFKMASCIPNVESMTPFGHLILRKVY